MCKAPTTVVGKRTKRRERRQGLLAQRSCSMKKQLMIDEIDWNRIPIVAELAEARA
jgi:hypothetical protein